MKPKKMPPANFLHLFLSYEPQTGVLTKKRSGRPVKTIQGKYRVVYLNSRYYQASRVIWKMMTGEEPRTTIDHINRKRLDNRWANLREATLSQQNANSPSMSNNTSGVRGVNKDRNGWRVRIMVDGKRLCLGTFATRNEAMNVYNAAARKAFGKFANL